MCSQLQFPVWFNTVCCPFLLRSPFPYPLHTVLQFDYTYLKPSLTQHFESCTTRLVDENRTSESDNSPGWLTSLVELFSTDIPPPEPHLSAPDDIWLTRAPPSVFEPYVSESDTIQTDDCRQYTIFTFSRIFLQMCLYWVSPLSITVQRLPAISSQVILC